MKKLGEIADKITDGTHDTPKPVEEGIPFLTAIHIKDGFVDYKNCYYLEQEVHNIIYKRCNPEKNDLLIVNIGAGTATCALNIVDYEFSLKNVALVKPNKNIIDGIYLAQLQRKNSAKIFNQLTSGGAQPFLSLKEIGRLLIKFPSLSEQQKIASFLSLVDERIATQNKIIEQLETLIKGLSEKLFSQKIRFKDFTDEWELKSLGDIFYSEKGKGISKDKLTVNGKYECVLYGELYTKYKEVIFDVVSKTNEDDGLKSQIGDLLIPSSTTTTGIDLANVTAINKENVLLGGDITVLRSKDKINNVFYAYYLSNYKKTEIASYAQGSTIVHLYYSHIKNMSIDFPSFEEQAVIAQFLSFIDMKIQTEKNILDTYHSQKKHLLQNLFI